MDQRSKDAIDGTLTFLRGLQRQLRATNKVKTGVVTRVKHVMDSRKDPPSIYDVELMMHFTRRVAVGRGTDKKNAATEAKAQVLSEVVRSIETVERLYAAHIAAMKLLESDDGQG